MVLQPGDHLLIPARARHRVDFTETPTVWLAVHFEGLG
jgi:cupin 2 domain-containing protein